MFGKIKDLIIHPKRIGLYYKDSFFKIFSYIFVLFIILASLTAVVVFNTDYLNHAHSRDVSSAIIHMNKSDIVYDKESHTLSGSPMSASFDDKVIYFFADDNSIKAEKKFIFNFKGEEVDLIFSGFKFSTVKYSEINAESFSLSLVQDFNDKEIIKLEEFLDIMFVKANSGYSKLAFYDTVIMDLIMYGVIVIVGLLSAWIRKPEINSTIRAKLTLYSTSVYFIGMLLSLLYNAIWIEYVAMAIPIIYVNITFSRIVKVVRREGE